MSRRRPFTPEVQERLTRTVTVVCNEDPKGRVCKIQTFVHEATWEPQFPKHVETVEGAVKHRMRCKLCGQEVQATDSKMGLVLDALLSRDVHQVTLSGLRFALERVAR